MFTFNPLHRKTRRYAKRLPSEFARRVILSVRVNVHVRRAVISLASQRNMSASEYLARLLSDHLSEVTRSQKTTSLLGAVL